MILSDVGIKQRMLLPLEDPRRLRVTPCESKETLPLRGLSYGITSAGIDFRLSREFLILPATHVMDAFNELTEADANKDLSALFGVCERQVVADPTVDMNPIAINEIRNDYYILKPGHMVLGMTVEYFKMPKDVSGTVVGRSSYARCGLCLNTTVIEPGWEGHITLEMSNISHVPIRLHVGGGIGQLKLEVTDQVVEKSYADKDGRYQGQRRPTLPIPRKVETNAVQNKD